MEDVTNIMDLDYSRDTVLSGDTIVLPLGARISAFRRYYPDYALVSAVKDNDNFEFAIVRASILDAAGVEVSTGLSSATFAYDGPRFIETAEDRARLRALSGFGIGCQFDPDNIHSDLSQPTVIIDPVQEQYLQDERDAYARQNEAAKAAATQPPQVPTVTAPPKRQKKEKPAETAPSSVVGPVGMIRRISEITALWPEDLATEWANHIVGRYKIDPSTELSKLDHKDLSTLNNQIVFAEQVRALGGIATPAMVFNKFDTVTPEEAVESQRPKEDAQEPAGDDAGGQADEAIQVDDTIRASPRLEDAIDNEDRLVAAMEHLRINVPQMYATFMKSMRDNFDGVDDISKLSDNQIARVLKVFDDRVAAGQIPPVVVLDDPFADS